MDETTKQEGVNGVEEQQNSVLEKEVNTNSSDVHIEGKNTNQSEIVSKTTDDVELTEYKSNVDEDTSASAEDSKEQTEAEKLANQIKSDGGETSMNEEDQISDNDEEVDLGDTESLDSDGRNKLFEKGLTYDNQKKRNCALKCYLGCLNGLKRNSRFSLLPQCLRNIADIYYQKEEFDRAVHFIQAEKVFYETALIDTADIQHRLEEAHKQTQNGDSPHDQNLDTLRADEYEHLARMCLDKKQPQLALEYAGKATKIRQQLLGDSHPITVQSLDFFASVYAEVGAEQYKESMKVFNSESQDGDNQVPIVDVGQSKSEPVSILRKRKSLDKEKRVRFLESQVKNHEQRAKEETIAKSVLWSLLVVCIILLLVLGVYLYCHTSGNSQSCSTLRTTIHYAYMRLKYLYFHYTSTKDGSKYT